MRVIIYIWYKSGELLSSNSGVNVGQLCTAGVNEQLRSLGDSTARHCGDQ